MIPALADEVAATVVKRAAARPRSAALLPSAPLTSFGSAARTCWALITGSFGLENEVDAVDDTGMSFKLDSDAPERA